MTKALPGKKGFWGHIRDGLHDLVWTGSRGARINAEAQERNNQNLIEYYDKRDNIQQKKDMAQMQLQAVMQQRSLEVQAEQGNLNRKVQMIEGQLNRQLQAELAELNRLFQSQEGQLNRQLQVDLAVFNQNCQAREGMLNRELQADLARLNREFQANEGKLNRQFQAELEMFRAKLQVFLQEQQKEFQLQLKEIDATLAKELKKMDLQNNLTVVRQQRRLNNWPLTLDDEQIKEMMTSDKLMILFVPPILKFDSAGTGSNSTPNNFPEIEEGLKRRIRVFIEKYQQNGRDIDYLTGVWKTKALSAEGAIKTILNTLKPMVIINTIVERSYYHLEYGYATDLIDKPYIGSLPKEESLSWLELLYDATKERLLKWEEQRNLEAEEHGTTKEFDDDWGLEVVKKFLADLELIKREKRHLKRGQNPAELPNRNYTILDSDKEEFCRFLSIQICILIGKFADEYFILDVPPQKRKPPLLPQLLPDLLKDVPAEYQIEIVEAVIAFSKLLYQQLEDTESAWIPEMLLSLAYSLTFLDNKSYATEQVEESVRCWLLMRGIKSLKDVSNLEIMKFVITPEANKYMEYLSQCLDLLPNENLPYAQTLYQTWQRLKIRGLLPVDKEGYTLFNR